MSPRARSRATDFTRGPRNPPIYIYIQTVWAGPLSHGPGGGAPIAGSRGRRPPGAYIYIYICVCGFLTHWWRLRPCRGPGWVSHPLNILHASRKNLARTGRTKSRTRGPRARSRRACEKFARPARSRRAEVQLMASAEHKMAFAEHARKGGAGLRVFPRSTDAYHPRRKNIMNSIFRQNVFAKNNVLQITYISPRLPQRFVLFCFFFVSPQRVYPFWNSNSKQIPFWEFKFHCRNMSRVSGTHVTVNAIKCHFLECRTTRVSALILALCATA